MCSCNNLRVLRSSDCAYRCTAALLLPDHFAHQLIRMRMILYLRYLLLSLNVAMNPFAVDWCTKSGTTLECISEISRPTPVAEWYYFVAACSTAPCSTCSSSSNMYLIDILPTCSSEPLRYSRHAVRRAATRIGDVYMCFVHGIIPLHRVCVILGESPSTDKEKATLL